MRRVFGNTLVVDEASEIRSVDCRACGATREGTTTEIVAAGWAPWCARAALASKWTCASCRAKRPAQRWQR
jgi:hypothetical protein